MKTILQINVTCNTGSTGRIAEGIGEQILKQGWRSVIAYGRGNPTSKSELIRIGNKWDMYWHGLETRCFDNHGLASRNATRKFVKQIKEIKPDVIHLHNIHGYYLNYKILFEYLYQINVPVVWTMHDCWPFTGHCAYFSRVGCSKWFTQCEECEQYLRYPSSFVDNSPENFRLKKELFDNYPQLFLIPVSDWLKSLLQKSFLCDKQINTIYNGIDLKIFRLHEYIPNKFRLLGVANIWSDRKGLSDFIELRNRLDSNYEMILVGLTNAQIKDLPTGIVGVKRTDTIDDLSRLYSMSDIYLNLTYEDNFPTTNLEALACGTPVVTYRTGGSPEAISSETGFVIEQGDLDGVLSAIKQVREKGRSFYEKNCRLRAEVYFDMHKQYAEYIELYNTIS